jgi:protein-L-isoaspartate(D-aspartate) O-methyltransferase
MDKLNSNTMVFEQIVLRGVSDESVLEAMRTVPRHRFVRQADSENAHGDFPLPIGFGQTISQPYIVAYMCELARLSELDRVLDVGTGSGYNAAVMAQIVDRVYSIEIVPELALCAIETVSELNYDNITIRSGDGYYGWPEEAPFDAIVVTAAADHIPSALVDQLAEGGRMVIPLGNPFEAQELVLVEKKENQIEVSRRLAVRFVPLIAGKSSCIFSQVDF